VLVMEQVALCPWVSVICCRSRSTDADTGTGRVSDGPVSEERISPRDYPGTERDLFHHQHRDSSTITVTKTLIPNLGAVMQTRSTCR